MRPLTTREKGTLLRQLPARRRLLQRSPHLSFDETRAWQFGRVRALVEHAYHAIPMYRDLYSAVGFEPGDLRGWDEFHRLPLVTKDRLIDGYPEQTLARGTDPQMLISSRSSGSSGKVLDLCHFSRP